MTRGELRASLSLASIFALRMLGLFLILPVFAEYAHTLPDGHDAQRVGLAMGIYGLMQAFLHIPLGWLSDSKMALGSVIAVNVWKGIPFFTLLLLAGLKAIDTELYEAAEVDGANAVQRFWSISLPTIKGVVAFVAITWFLGALQMFTQSYVMTGGGPVSATRTIVYLMYDEAFTNLSIGKACAMAVMLFLLVVALSLILRVILRPKGQV